ncbi:MAG TPA: zinc ribbon domain-containing protein [Abditibacteriaceae bacterium]|jgi:hypothetical protein
MSESNTQRCQKCAAYAPLNARFCPSCAAPFGDVQVPVGQTPEKGNKVKFLIAGVAFVAGVAGYASLRHQPQETEVELIAPVRLDAVPKSKLTPVSRAAPRPKPTAAPPQTVIEIPPVPQVAPAEEWKPIGAEAPSTPRSVTRRATSSSSSSRVSQFRSVDLFQEEGSGIKTTGTFTATQPEWELGWLASVPYDQRKFGGGAFAIMVYRANGQLVTIAGNQMGLEARGDTTIHESGEFYLTINSTMDWDISAFEIRPR